MLRTPDRRHLTWSTFASVLLCSQQILGHVTQQVKSKDTLEENKLNVIKRELKDEDLKSSSQITSDFDAEFFNDEDEDIDFWDYADIDINTTENGRYLGSRCRATCNTRLQHVICHATLQRCVCEQKFSVNLGPAKGCAKPQKLGEQCFYRQTCRAYDDHSSCVQIEHKAFCQCDEGYHAVSYTRPVKKTFCTEDMSLLTADVPTLLGVASGIAVLAGLICFVLHLYTKARYPNPHLADASLTPPMLYSLNENGHIRGSSTRPSSRSSSRSVATGGTLDSTGSRRDSKARGVVVSASRAGAARAAAILLISCHLRAHPVQCAAQGSRRPSIGSIQSGSSSIKSYSLRRFEKEKEQKERRQMQARLAQLHINMASNMAAHLAVNMASTSETDIPKHAPTPSPRSPNNSTDGLLPSLCQIKEMSIEDGGIINPCPGTSQQY